MATLPLRHRGTAPSAFHRDFYWSGFIYHEHTKAACPTAARKNGRSGGGGAARLTQPQWFDWKPVHRLTFASTLGVGRDNTGSVAVAVAVGALARRSREGKRDFNIRTEIVRVINSMAWYHIASIIIGAPAALLALVKLGGWVRRKREGKVTEGDQNSESGEEVVWQDFVEDIESLEGATDVNSHQEDYCISLEYNRSRRQFHQQTEYDYEILDFKKPLLMVEPLG